MTALTLAKPGDIDRVIRLVTDFYAEGGVAFEETALHGALTPLLEGSPHGAIYLIGPARAPIGHVVISFGWSVEFGGMTGTIDEFYIRKAVRGRGIGTEVLSSLPKALAEAGLKALSLHVGRDDARARNLYEKLRFVAYDNAVMMTRAL